MCQFVISVFNENMYFVSQKEWNSHFQDLLLMLYQYVTDQTDKRENLQDALFWLYQTVIEQQRVIKKCFTGKSN